MVELDEDEDGDPVTTLVVEEKQEAPDRVQKPAKLSPSETNALNALDKAMAQNPMVAIVGAPPVERPVTTEPLWHRCTPTTALWTSDHIEPAGPYASSVEGRVLTGTTSIRVLIGIGKPSPSNKLGNCAMSASSDSAVSKTAITVSPSSFTPPI